MAFVSFHNHTLNSTNSRVLWIIATRATDAECWAAENTTRKHKIMTDQRDHLTQLLTREAFDAALLTHFSKATTEQPASLLMADIDHFKKVNDNYGHQIGDIVLKEISHRLDRIIQGKGFAYRYGGEEFAVILPNHTAEEALAVGERARRAVEAEKAGDVSVTSSYGVAVVPLHASSVEDWLNKADQALYEAKHLGRNLVRLSGEPPPETHSVRKPTRRAPEPGILSDEAKEELRLQILKRGRALCPVDQVPLEHHDSTGVNDIGKSFIVICPGCGFKTELPSLGHG